MKKLLATIFSLCVLMVMTTSVFAANTASETFVCPNGNTVCINNGACVNDGQCKNTAKCPNNGVRKRDGSGHHRGGQGRGYRRGNCNR